MKINGKGQLTIPQHVRNQLGLLPHGEVEFELAGDHACMRKVTTSLSRGERGRRAVEALRGTANTRMSIDEIMALTRGEGQVARDLA